MPGGLQHRIDGLGIKPRRPHLATQSPGGVALAQRAPVGSWLHQRVVHVCCREQALRRREHPATNGPRVARPVLPLVVHPGDPRQRLERRGPDEDPLFFRATASAGSLAAQHL